VAVVALAETAAWLKAARGVHSISASGLHRPSRSARSRLSIEQAPHPLVPQAATEPARGAVGLGLTCRSPTG
jgi:hypothetical protein